MKMMRRVLVIKVIDKLNSKGLSLGFSQPLEQRQKFRRLLLIHIRQNRKVPSRGDDDLSDDRIRSILMSVKVRRFDDRPAQCFGLSFRDGATEAIGVSHARQKLQLDVAERNRLLNKATFRCGKPSSAIYLKAAMRGSNPPICAMRKHALRP